MLLASIGIGDSFGPVLVVCEALRRRIWTSLGGETWILSS